MPECAERPEPADLFAHLPRPCHPLDPDNVRRMCTNCFVRSTSSQVTTIASPIRTPVPSPQQEASQVGQVLAHRVQVGIQHRQPSPTLLWWRAPGALRSPPSRSPTSRTGFDRRPLAEPPGHRLRRPPTGRPSPWRVLCPSAPRGRIVNPRLSRGGPWRRRAGSRVSADHVLFSAPGAVAELLGVAVAGVRGLHGDRAGERFSRFAQDVAAVGYQVHLRPTYDRTDSCVSGQPAATFPRTQRLGGVNRTRPPTSSPRIGLGSHVRCRRVVRYPEMLAGPTALRPRAVNSFWS